jgi:UDP-2,3-diacylglucosamine pyrophosphatase LpxH
MRVVRKTERYKAGQTFTIWPIGDTHLGAIDTNESLLKEHLKKIEEDPNARIIFMGDVGDCITHRDPRFGAGMWTQRYLQAAFEEGGIPTEVVNHAYELFKPVREKIWVWLSGNHEKTIRKHTDREIGSEIAGALQIPYLAYNGFLRVSWKRETSKASAEFSTTFDLAHGWQGGRRSGAKLNQMELELAESDADIILRGHSHDRVAQIVPSLSIGTNNVKEWNRIIAHTGTYKVGRVDNISGDEVHTTWEETRGFKKKTNRVLGPPLIQISPTSNGHPTVEAGSIQSAKADYRIIL